VTHLKFRALLFLGIAFLVLGFIALLINIGGLELLGGLWAILPLSFGLVLVIIFYIRPKRLKNRFLFLGVWLTQISLFTLLVNIFWPEEWGAWILKLWPIYVSLTGLSFIPVAFQYKYRKRISLLIPAWVLLMLSLIVLLFSLDFVNMSLAAFVGRWWPIFFLILGGSLIIAYWFQRYGSKGDE
jgi:hypothetical protein